ncbi:DUF5753 domain-containing protein [Nocardiopsis sp. NPDC050513]|uniref:DUF5753 domain-containing protein n=1 Tax=Nocardiopsis sp. NPDC050513 TaxID=3364338 RepID=UPI00378D63B5
MTDYFREIAEYERSATEIRQYAMGIIPGLAQMECYARTITQLALPHAPPKQIDEMVAVRMHRQEILERAHPPVFTVVLDESILYRTFRDPGVMRAQINRLVELSYRPRITIQVVPMMTEGHPGLDGSFRLMTVPDSGDFAYIEGREVGLPIKEPELVQNYERVFADLRSAALPVLDSRARMEEIRGALP